MSDADDSLPPSVTPSPQRWLQQNLFNTWYNSLLTIGCGWLLYSLWLAVYRWLTTAAQWSVVTENLRLFLVGRYPLEQTWRLWLVLGLAIALVAIAGFRRRLGHRQTLTFSVGYPLAYLVMLWLIGGGLGLSPVGRDLWNGLLLTLVLALTSTILAFPFGVVLAVGRQSSLPIVRGFCTLYVELVRGLPLIGILFMGQAMLPLILSRQLRLDQLVRAIASLVIFNAAYLAENVRGGLQAIPRGQTEAAKALGLNGLQTLGLVVLPQALRIVIPAIVGQFISLFKDTSLLALFSLLELTGIARSVLAQPDFLGRNAEVYLFIGLIYWAFCYWMSWTSRRLERHRD